MSEKANRLDRWKILTAAAVVADVSEYIGFAPMPFHRSRGMQATATPTHTTLLTMLPVFSLALLFFTAFPAFWNKYCYRGPYFSPDWFLHMNGAAPLNHENTVSRSFPSVCQSL